nr:rRNA large subunit methyltransferase I [Lachnospiraceae bacterium]
MAVAVLKKGEGRTVKAGGAWIYDNEIESVMGSFTDGDIVEVRDFDSFFLGKGYINSRSKIRIRLLTRRRDEIIDAAFFEIRVREAWQYRKDVVDTSSCRLIFSEADYLPGIVIDKFSDVLVVESETLGIERF